MKTKSECKKEPKPTGKIYESGHQWGNNIMINVKGDIGHITGWVSDRPINGDQLRVYKEGTSYLVTMFNVKNCNDPKDMFFASFDPNDLCENIIEMKVKV